MADRVIPPSSGSGDSNERRPAPPRAAGDYSGRSQPTRVFNVNGERVQPARSASQRPQPTRGSSASGDRRPAGSRIAGSSGARPPRRTDVIRCENCGEDYNISYKRCPFCDERPGRGGVTGKRVSNTRGGGYGRPVNPIQIAGLVVSLILIASALFIVVRFLGAPIFNRDRDHSTGSDMSSSRSNYSDRSNTGTPANPNTATQTVQSIALNNTDFPLDNAGSYQLTANLLPAGAEGEVTWSSSDSTAAVVDSSGLVTNVNTRSEDVVVTVSAACGDVTTSTTVTCKGKSGGTVTAGTTGRIVNAQKGLNIRSGPGKEYGVVASAQNGSIVTILGEENGFYKINYSGDKIGYVSKDYVSIGS